MLVPLPPAPAPASVPDSVFADTAAVHEPSWLEVDLTVVEQNFRTLRGAAGGDSPVRVCGVVKKNAYGVGAAPVALRLVRAGCEMLAVFSPEEAEGLLGKGVNCPLLLLMPLRSLHRTDRLYRHAIAGRLHLSLHDVEGLGQIAQLGQTFGFRPPVHVLLDTGMSRSGLSLSQLPSVLGVIRDMRNVRLAGIFTHLATADTDVDFAHHQMGRFEAALAEHEALLGPGVVRHAANTFGTLRDARFHLDMIRPGLGLLGFGEDLMRGPRLDTPALRPCLRWMSRLIHVQRYAKSTPVGYGSTHRLERDSVLGVVGVGYGDGYPVSLGNTAAVRVCVGEGGRARWVEAPLRGAVNMDQIVVDLTDAAAEAESGAPPRPGTLVEVMTSDPTAPNALARLAEIAGTHPYEMLCRLSPTIKRCYVHE